MALKRTSAVLKPRLTEQVLMDSAQQRSLQATFKEDPDFFDVADLVKTPALEPINRIDTRPTYVQPCYLLPINPQVLPERNTTHGNGTRSTLWPSSRITTPIVRAAKLQLCATMQGTLGISREISRDAIEYYYWIMTSCVVRITLLALFELYI